MADVKISELPAAASVTTADLIPIVQSGDTDYATVAQVRAAIMPADLTSADVTGVLPKANQGAQDMAGDVTGTTAASVVAKVNGATVPAAGSLTTGNVPQVSAASALTYGPVNLAGGANYVTGTLPVANGGFTAPTGTGMVSATSGAIDAASRPVGTGFYTFAATPSSANLAALVTDETGTGSLVFGTSPLFKTGLSLNNPSDTFKYTFVGSNIGADTTVTVPLLISNDTLVTQAHSQTLTNKTITTPFINGGSFTFANPAGTFSYTIQPAAIAAARTLTLPLLTAGDTMVCEAFTQTLTNKTIVAASNTITDTSATTGDILRHNGTRFVRLARGTANQVLQTNAGATDIAWATISGTFTAGGDLTGTSSSQTVAKINGATVPAAGALTTGHVLQVSGASATTYAYVANANVDAAAAIAGTKISPNFGAQTVQTTGQLYIGSNYGTAGSSFINSDAAGSVCFGVNGATKYEVCSATSTIQSSYPLIGSNGTSFTDSSAYGIHGGCTVTPGSNANYTLTAAEYCYDWIIVDATAWSATHSIVLPAPATKAKGYYKTIWAKTGGYDVTVSTGAGNTISVAYPYARRVWVDDAGVFAAGGITGATKYFDPTT